LEESYQTLYAWGTGFSWRGGKKATVKFTVTQLSRINMEEKFELSMGSHSHFCSLPSDLVPRDSHLSLGEKEL
jgi:hypothetical protein